MNKQRLFIGFEFSHPAPISQAAQASGDSYKSPSVVGFGANCGRVPQYFLGDCRYVPAHQSEVKMSFSLSGLNFLLL